jgi:hypothetical protein
VPIILTSELIFREEYNSRWLRYYLEKFNLNFAQASVTIRPPLLPVPPTPTPLVPSTPIPEGLIFGSSAWQPGSQTPGRLLDEQEGPSDRHDTHSVPLLPHRQIPKPPGWASRTNGWLQQALEVDQNIFSEMRVSPKGCH